MTESIRLQKYFSDCGVLSRRAAEAEILAGHVTVNGIPAALGDRVTLQTDRVEWNGKPVLPRADKPYRYILLNKPRGYVCTAKDEKGRRNVTELVHIPDTRLYPVGRLDMDSDGLLILTDDGNFANHMTHPRHEIPKIYRVEVSPAPTDAMLEALRAPMELDGYRLLPVGVRKLGDNLLEMELHEGRNRQIRRMCEAVGLQVTALTRIAIGSLTLGRLPHGKWRELSPEEVRYLMQKKTKGRTEMLEVLPIQTKTEQEALCARCGIPFRTELLAYQALVDGELRGICQFTMGPDGGRIVDFAACGTPEFEPMFVMGRAALNFIDLCGVHRAFFDADSENETLIKAIGFERNSDGRWEMDLTDFFKEPCKHSKSSK